MTDIMEYLQYPFVRYAFIVGILISVCCALLGTVLVAKNMSFVGDSLSKVAFTSSILAGVCNLKADLALTFVCTLIFTLILLNKKQSDSYLAVISVSALAIGYIAINVFGKGGNVSGDVCTVLFGSTSILTLKDIDVVTCVILCIFVTIVFICFYNKIFAVILDADFAKTRNIGVKKVNLVISILIAATITLATKMVGSLLITALIVLPTLSAGKSAKSHKSVVTGGVFFSVLCSVMGLSLAIIWSLPVGAAITLTDLFLFLAVCFIDKIWPKTSLFNGG